MPSKLARSAAKRRRKSRVIEYNSSTRGRDLSCCWCVKPLTFTEATLEHLLPIVLGGDNSLENMEISCGPCNWRRGNKYYPSISKQLRRAHDGDR